MNCKTTPLSARMHYPSLHCHLRDIVHCLAIALLAFSLGCQETNEPSSDGAIAEQNAAKDTDTLVDPQALSSLTKPKEEKDLSPVQLTTSSDSQRWINLDELPMTLGYAQYVAGKRIGYSRITIEKSTISVKELLRITRFDSIRALTAGSSGRIDSTLTSIEQNTGQLRSFTLDIQEPQKRSIVDAALTGKNVEVSTAVESLVDGETEKKRVNVRWQEGTWGTLGIQQILRIADLEPGREYNATVLLPRINKIADVQMRVLEPELTTLGSGKIATLPLVETLLTINDPKQDEPMRTGAKSWFNEDGWIEKTVTLGNPSVLSLRIDTAELERLESIAAIEKYAQVSIPVVRSREITLSAEPAWQVIAEKTDPYSLFEDSPRQRRKSADPRTVELQLSSSGTTGEFAEAQRDLWLSSLPNIPADDPLLKKFAAPLDKLSPAEIPDVIATQLDSKFKATPINPEMPSPLEALRTGKADALQFASLAAAILRSRSVPTRLVIGIRVPKSSGDASLHIWAEALVGSSWKLIGQGLQDATLLRFDSDELNQSEVSIFATLEKWMRQISALKRVSQK